MPLKSSILSGNKRLEQAAAGPPSVKKRPPDDDVDAVKRIQKALVALGFKMPVSFANGSLGEPDGIFGDETFKTVQAYQRREFAKDSTQWDGRVGKDTLARMDEQLGGSAGDDDDFSGFNGEQIDLIKADLQRANRMLGVVNRRLRAVAATAPGGGLLVTPRSQEYYNTKLVILNVFKINTFTADDFPVPSDVLDRLRRQHRNLTLPEPSGSASDAIRFGILFENFARLQSAINQRFPKQFFTDSTFKGQPIGFFAAFVDATNPNDSTVRFTRRYFDETFVDADGRSVTVAHERAHTIFRASGHPGTGDNPFCVAPHLGDPNVTGFEQAIANPYCYEWMTYALQPDYNVGKHRGAECGT